MGGAGFTVSYTRKVWAGDTLKSEQSFTWTYDPQNAYVEVGPPEKPSTSTAPGGTTTAPGGETTAPDAQTAPPRARGATTSASGAAPPP
jgi:hypothetical protein